MDEPRRQLVASLAARIRRVELWADENDIILRRKTGVSAHPVVADWDRWEARLEQLVERLDREGRDVTDSTAIELDLEQARNVAQGLRWEHR